jgi:hypothetical protein
MTKRKNLSKAQLHLKQRVVNAYSKPRGFLYVHPAWNKNLWKKTTSDIYEFLEGRFRETLDVVEYYSTMVLLWRTLPNSELLVEFHQSPQWMEVAKTYDYTGENKPVPRNKQNMTEHGAQPIETVKSVDTIQVIGD